MPTVTRGEAVTQICGEAASGEGVENSLAATAAAASGGGGRGTGIGAGIRRRTAACRSPSVGRRPDPANETASATLALEGE